MVRCWLERHAAEQNVMATRIGLTNWLFDGGGLLWCSWFAN
jgi:hypothetical protein